MLTNINVLFYLAAYLIGAIPFGLILAKAFANTDIRTQGSQSIGATNVLRVLKETNPAMAKKLAIATVVLDALKGLAVILVAAYLGLSPQTQWTIGVLAVIGHCFSPYLKFEGGKGVATAVGVVLYFLPLETLIAFSVWYLLGRTVRISSVSSLGALGALIISSFLIHYEMPHINTHAPLLIIAFVVVYKHIPNIMRLLGGKEKQVI
ncbi:glycerol-3-phosphate 1-O-acyltransferase PlsY [Sulfurospirillum sp. T05]|uniref:Glycerol-3-phosphate acyltransferase n=1 Tax=Sulfurospirillum tamanense TaxID=2813362 RepID=A0ABS2WQE8_9BACT|nr:glycerol-3-phosphate 1-O-acyltransferase PlsY [Sulfurospirillum tamanensis]MBN2963444.1 glycerol-3-phosphate 1-O-acyltransferase PlsY [Sulfurospirillum tamanensis]